MSETPRPGIFRKITSPANDLVKDLRALHGKKARDETGLFLAEGLKLVRDAAEAGWPIRTLVYGLGQVADPAIAQLAAKTKAGGGTVLEANAAVLEKITRRENPQTVVGVFAQRFAPAESLGQHGIWIALDRVRDPGNLGTIIRTADAAGLAGVALVGQSCDAFGIETVRATMGSVFHVPLVRVSEEDFLAQISRSRARLVGTHLTAETVDYRGADYGQPLVLLMGNEQQGLTERLAQACDLLVKIPMRGRADSLNLAVSTAVVVYEALRDRPAGET